LVRKKIKEYNIMKYKALSLALMSICAVAQADVLVTTAYLSGPAESPPVDSPGMGFAIVTYDSTAHTLRVQATFSGLLAGVTAAHIHAPVVPPAQIAGVATQTPTFSGFPSGVTSGDYDQTFDLTLASSYNAAFVTASGGIPEAEARLAASLANGSAYFNIHTTAFLSGEIRGFLLVDSDADGVPDSVDAFPNSRNVGGNVTIGDCDTGVANVLFPDGSTINDLVDELASNAKNHGQFVSGVAKLNNELRKASVLSPQQASAIQKCAAGSRKP
jgi:hypothetical protein